MSNSCLSSIGKKLIMSMKPLGIVSVILPKRLPKPAAIITAVVTISVVFCGYLYMMHFHRLFEDNEELFDILRSDGA